MQIPKQFGEFSFKTLIVCADHHRAKLYSVYKNQLQEEQPIEAPETLLRYSDREGFGFATTYAGRTTIASIPGNEPHNPEHYTEVMTNVLLQTLLDRHKNGPYDKVVLFVPDDMKKPITEKVPQELREHFEVIPRNVINMPVLEMLQLIAPGEG